MACTRVAGQGGGSDTASGGTFVDYVFPGNVSSGNLLVVGVAAFTGTNNNPCLLSMIAKQAGGATLGTWTMDSQILYKPDGTNYIACAVYSVPVTGTGSLTVRFNHPQAAVDSVFIGCQELAGADLSATRQDGQNTGTGTTGNAPVTATFTTTTDGYILAVETDGRSSGTEVAGTNYALVFAEDNTLKLTGHVEDRLTTVALSNTTGTWPNTLNGGWCCAAAAYKADQTPLMAGRQCVGQP